MSTPPANYTTTVPARRTVAEIQDMLAKAGASSIVIDYANGAPSGLSFSLPTVHGPRWFSLPARVDRVHAVLLRTVTGRKLTTPEHAERVAWRVLRDWLRAQLTLVEADLVTVGVALLAYAHTDERGTTLGDLYEHRERLAVAALTASGAS